MWKFGIDVGQGFSLGGFFLLLLMTLYAMLPATSLTLGLALHLLQ
jgi:hypothetical protein